MSAPDWPSPEQQQRPLPLPRVEDLPVAEQGYDREAVRQAFDSFYRHAAQLDATLRTLEAVEVFQRTASELRAELRTVRAAGWTVGGYGGAGAGTRGGVREWSLPPAFPRVAAEALFLIVIGVIVGIAGWSRIAIVLVMGLALAIVWLVEWVASRERTAIPQAVATPTPPRLDEEEQAELPAPEAAGWTAFSEQEEGPEAMTMLSAEPAQAAEEPSADEEAEPEPEPVPAPVPPPEDAVEAEAADRVPVAQPADDELLPVAEPAEEDELAVSDEPEFVAQSHETEPAEEPEPDTAEHAVDEPVKQRFRLWRREAAALDEPEPRVDPWEREPELPAADAELEPEAALEEELEEPEARFRWLRDAGDAVPLEADVEPEPEQEPDEEPRSQDLPVEALTEQAEAALARSRERRRAPRRARRR